MFFDRLSDLPTLAASSGFAIFFLPETILNNQTPKRKNSAAKTAADSNPLSHFFPPANSLIISPDPDRQIIAIDQVRALEPQLAAKQTVDQFILVFHADFLNEPAQNAMLKLLEEPRDFYHFVFLAHSLKTFLPTILSRASLFYLRETNPLSTISADPKLINLAKQLLTTKTSELIPFIERLIASAPYKKAPRPYALSLLAATIELAYKSFYKTNDPKFLAKLPKLLNCYHNLAQNGHLKLHLIADLI